MNERPYETPEAAELDEARAPWTTPRLARLDAADAEGGGNPINPEGPFSTGS